MALFDESADAESAETVGGEGGVSSRQGERAWDALVPHQRLSPASDGIAAGCPCRGSVGSGSLVCA